MPSRGISRAHCPVVSERCQGPLAARRKAQAYFQSEHRDNPACARCAEACSEHHAHCLGKREKPCADKADKVTVVALDDWTITVTEAPAKALTGVPVNLTKARCSASPAIAFSPSVYNIIPSRNNPMLPSSLKVMTITSNLAWAGMDRGLMAPTALPVLICFSCSMISDIRSRSALFDHAFPVCR